MTECWAEHWNALVLRQGLCVQLLAEQLMMDGAALSGGRAEMAECRRQPCPEML
jgi:hypothetical protein